jgi:pimeloyl-ACP methyl ester carboxylesterase
MRGVGMLFLLMSLLLGQILQAQIPIPQQILRRPIPHSPVKQVTTAAAPLVRQPEAMPLLKPLANNVVQVTCSADAQGAGASMCGYVNVPLDRQHPKKGTIGIYFEQYLNSSGGPAVSAILGNFGGPGSTTTGNRGSFLAFFGADLDVHDLLLIDDRGRGLSGTINCPDMQNGTASFDQGVAECAAQLGAAASRYGTGDIAEDTDAVRAALGYELIDYYGGSYGGADVNAYATRFGQHLRSIVLDAPVGKPYLDETRFAIEWYRTHAEVPTVTRQCKRSPLCSVDHPFPQADLEGLVLSLQLKPVTGEAYDANGTLVQVTMDEKALLNYVLDNPTGYFLSTGEVLAAAQSLWRGDTRPLLRLGAEGYFPINPNYGDPTGFSAGAYLATSCVDVEQPYAWSSPIPQRMVQLDDAVSALPFWYFAPFSREAPTGVVFSYGAINGGRGCLNWEKPTPSSPVFPLNPIFPVAPTLVMSGDLDRRVPYAEVSQVAAMFPNNTLVSVAGAGHETVFWGQCPAYLASSFIETLQVPDTTCAKSPETVWPSVGRFPLYARNAQPAQPDSSGLNQIGTQEEKVVSVAVATVVDALQRSIIGFGNGVGLRGGTFHTDYGVTQWTTTLTNCAFSTDVFVNGTINWYGDNSLKADLTVSGPGTAGGSLTVTGGWLVFGGPLGNFSITGTLGGKQVAVVVPEA